MNKEIQIVGSNDGPLVKGPVGDLIVARVARAKIHPEGAVIQPPDVKDKIARAAAVLRRRGWRVRIALELRVDEAIGAVEGWIAGRISEEVVPWLKALRTACLRPWWDLDESLKMGMILDRAGRNARRVGTLVLLEESEMAALQAALDSKDRRIAALLEELEHLRP